MPKVEEALFSKDQKIVCIDKKMNGILPVLEETSTYQVREFISPAGCEKQFPDNPAEWHKNDGRVEVEEFKGCYWYGRRFAAQ